MPFDLSITKPLEAAPWRYTTQPNPDGTGGVKETYDGAFILLDDALIEYIREALTDAQKTEIAPWIWRVSTETPLPAGHVSAAEWNVPIWSGTTRATYLRVPKLLWASAMTVPPAKIQGYLRKLYRS